MFQNNKKEVVYTQMPDEVIEGYHYEEDWVESATEKIQVWNLIKDKPQNEEAI